MLVVFTIGIIVSPTLTWAFDVSGWLWGASWLVTGFSLGLALFDGEVAAAGIATGIVASPILTWGFDVPEVIWLGAWAITGTMILGAFVSAETALAAGLLGFTVLAILVTVVGVGDRDNGTRSEHGFTREESDCLQYRAMGYREAFHNNDCDEVLRNAR